MAWWRGVCAAAAAAAVGGGALACPEGFEASAAGVAVRYDDGAVSTFRRDRDGVVTEINLFDDPDIDGYGVIAFHGIFVIEEYDLIDGAPDPDNHERQRFDVGLKALPAPAPGLSWTGTAQVVVGNADAFGREVNLSIGAAERVSYGACSYESWPVVLRHRDIGDDYVIGMDYLPLLGIAVMRSFADFGSPADSYTPVDIAPLTP
jgi:hypothetical protein